MKKIGWQMALLKAGGGGGIPVGFTGGPDPPRGSIGTACSLGHGGGVDGGMASIWLAGFFVASGAVMAAAPAMGGIPCGGAWAGWCCLWDWRICW